MEDNLTPAEEALEIACDAQAFTRTIDSLLLLADAAAAGVRPEGAVGKLYPRLLVALHKSTVEALAAHNGVSPRLCLEAAFREAPDEKEWQKRLAGMAERHHSR